MIAIKQLKNLLSSRRWTEVAAALVVLSFASQFTATFRGKMEAV
jgi:hypothetical protein